MKKHRLYGMRCYLSGAMDKLADHGVGWRDDITPFLEKMGVVVLNPCHKPIELANELEDRDRRKWLKESGDFDTASSEIKVIRIIDLRMVDMSDFMIVKIDTDVHACGTYEELGWANRMKRPILIWCEQGKLGIPDWLLGMVPHQHIFNSQQELLDYLVHVHMDEKVDHLKRWVFFDFTKIIPKVTVEESSKKACIFKKCK